MTFELVLVVGQSVALLLLGVAYSYRGRRLQAAENTIRAFKYREASAQIESEVKELEKKSRESSKKADSLLADYHKRFSDKPSDGGDKPN